MEKQYYIKIDGEKPRELFNEVHHISLAIAQLGGIVQNRQIVTIDQVENLSKELDSLKERLDIWLCEVVDYSEGNVVDELGKKKFELQLQREYDNTNNIHPTDDLPF